MTKEQLISEMARNVGYQMCLGELMFYIQDKTKFMAENNTIKCSEILDQFLNPKLKELEQRLEKVGNEMKEHE